MTKKAAAKTERTRYSAEFKQQALLDGASVAARDLGRQPAQIYAWRGRKPSVRTQRRAELDSEAKAHVFDYIEVYYNRNRLHSTLGYLSPEEFELSPVV